MEAQLALQKLLQERYADIRTRNPNYSLRAFARKIGIHSGALSSILNGKRNVSLKLAERISERLCLDPVEKAALFSMFPAKRNYTRRHEAMNSGAISSDAVNDLELTASKFKFFSDWTHQAILALLQTQDFQSDEAWIAKRLGLSEALVRDSIKRLFQLGLLTKTETGEWRRMDPEVNLSEDFTKTARRKAEEQALEISKLSIETIKQNLQLHRSMVFPVNLVDLESVRVRMQAFLEEMNATLSKDGEEEVYLLSMHFTPVTQKIGVR